MRSSASAAKGLGPVPFDTRRGQTTRVGLGVAGLHTAGGGVDEVLGGGFGDSVEEDAIHPPAEPSQWGLVLGAKAELGSLRSKRRNLELGVNRREETRKLS